MINVDGFCKNCGRYLFGDCEWCSTCHQPINETSVYTVSSNEENNMVYDLPFSDRLKYFQKKCLQKPRKKGHFIGPRVYQI
jgi:hypothetical protein